MKVEEYPSVTCKKCGCKYSFDKDDIKTEKEYIDTVQSGYKWYTKYFEEKEFVECPICGTVHVISAKETEELLSLSEIEELEKYM